MTTYRDLITGSLRLLGVKAQGQVATGAEAVDGLAVLNELIDSFNATGTLLYTTKTRVWTLTTTTLPFTIGPTGLIVETIRPTRLYGAWWRDLSNTPNTDRRLQVLADTDYNDIVAKTTTSDFPDAIYLDAQWPNANIYVWPAPASTTKALVLQYPTPLNSGVSLDDTESLPPAYRQMLRFNLAVMLAPEYGIEPSPTIVSAAISSRQLVEQANWRAYEMSFDIGSRGAYNINTDGYSSNQ